MFDIYCDILKILTNSSRSIDLQLENISMIPIKLISFLHCYTKA